MNPASPPARPVTVGFDQALAIIRRDTAPLPVRTLPIVDALGGGLARDVCARSHYPAFDMSAMDGYALSSDDTQGATAAAPSVHPIAGAIYAGGPAAGPGQTFGIATGARIPAGCDTVLQQERCTAIVRDGVLQLVVEAPVEPNRNIRRRGEDARAGERVACAGQMVTPAMIGAFACYGVTELAVRTAPAVSILTTGDELASLGGEPQGRIHDGNGPMLAASCRAAGLTLRSARSAGDDIDRIDAALDAILAEDRPDIILTTGGVSAGKRDLLPDVLARRGAVTGFHGVRMRPGKPVLFARVPQGPLVFALPGNPVAALLGFRFFVMEAVHALLGIAPERGEPVLVEQALTRGAADVFLKVRAHVGEDGTRAVDILPGQQSHVMRPLLHANAWLRITPDGAGQAARLYPLMPNFQSA